MIYTLCKIILNDPVLWDNYKLPKNPPEYKDIKFSEVAKQAWEEFKGILRWN